MSLSLQFYSLTQKQSEYLLDSFMFQMYVMLLLACLGTISSIEQQVPTSIFSFLSSCPIDQGFKAVKFSYPSFSVSFLIIQVICFICFSLSQIFAFKPWIFIFSFAFSYFCSLSFPIRLQKLPELLLSPIISRLFLTSFLFFSSSLSYFSIPKHQFFSVNPSLFFLLFRSNNYVCLACDTDITDLMRSSQFYFCSCVILSLRVQFSHTSQGILEVQAPKLSLSQQTCYSVFRLLEVWYFRMFDKDLRILKSIKQVLYESI